MGWEATFIQGCGDKEHIKTGRQMPEKTLDTPGKEEEAFSATTPPDFCIYCSLLNTG